MNEQQAFAWLSKPRYGRFLEACGGDHERATDLYQGHSELSVALFGLLRGFEVLLRNTIDAVLAEGQPQTPIEDTWMLDFNLLRPEGVKQVIVAIQRLERGKAITRGRVVAGVSFAFWADLFGRNYEHLWRHHLRHAFPQGALTRKDLSVRLQRMRRLRNRIAHHDSLLEQDTPARIEEILEVAEWIDPAAREWLARRSKALELAQSMREVRQLDPS
jgi:hypothetical protein